MFFNGDTADAIDEYTTVLGSVIIAGFAGRGIITSIDADAFTGFATKTGYKKTGDC